MATYNNYDKSLGAQHLAQEFAKNTYEAARSNFFTFIVGKEINGIVSVDGKKTFNNAQDAIRLNVTEADIPYFSLNTITFTRGNEVVKLAGTPSWNSGSIQVDDIVGLDTKSILMAWQGKAYDVHTGKGGRAKDYKIDCTLIEYTQDYEQVRSWTLYGCWISSISESGFNKSSGDSSPRSLQIKIEYDRAIMETPDE